MNDEDNKQVPFPEQPQSEEVPTPPSEPLMQLGLPGTEPFTTPAEGAENQQPEVQAEAQAEAPAPPPWATEMEDAFGKETLAKLAMYLHVPDVETAVRDIYQRLNLLLGLLQALGELGGLKLKSRQVPGGGLQFYWERSVDKRIIVPGRDN